MFQLIHLEFLCFQTNSNKIKITQTNNDNKDSSVNYSIVLQLLDKESVEKLVDVIRGII